MDKYKNVIRTILGCAVVAVAAYHCDVVMPVLALGALGLMAMVLLYYGVIFFIWIFSDMTWEEAHEALDGWC